MENSIGGISESSEDATEGIKKMGKELKGLAGFDEMNVLGGAKGEEFVWNSLVS